VDLTSAASTPGALNEAEFEFAWCRQAVGDVLAVLNDSGALTDLGRRFIAGMTDRLEQWSMDWVGGDAATAASRSLAALRISWRLRHLRLREEFLTSWLDAWRTGAPRPVARSSNPGHDVVANPMTGDREPRAFLIRLRAVDPGRFAILREHPRRRDIGGSLELPHGGGSPVAASTTPATEDGPELDDARLADMLLADGVIAAAAQLYHRALSARPHDVSAFGGLALALGLQRGCDVSAWWQAPELIRALWLRLRLDDGPDGAPDPDEVADFIGCAGGHDRRSVRE
jgi:hypothetical protein